MGSKDSRSKAQAPRKLSFWTFCTANGEICVPEKDLLAKRPVIRLVLESLMGEMKDYFDDAPGDTAAEKGCREVLYILDEAGNVELPSLPHDVATVRSRGI